MMRFKEFNVKSILALYIIVFCTCAIVFAKIDQMTKGALISIIGVPLGYFFGASKIDQKDDKNDKNDTKT